MLNNLTRLDKKRIFFYYNFGFVPFSLLFFYTTKNKFLFSKNKIRYFFIYNGRFWQKIFFSKWRLGFSLNFFIWSKYIAIFKKKQFLKKKKNG